MRPSFPHSPNARTTRNGVFSSGPSAGLRATLLSSNLAGSLPTTDSAVLALLLTAERAPRLGTKIDKCGGDSVSENAKPIYFHLQESLAVLAVALHPLKLTRRYFIVCVCVCGGQGEREEEERERERGIRSNGLNEKEEGSLRNPKARLFIPVDWAFLQRAN